MKKLIDLVSIAFAICLTTGLGYAKKHSYKVNSFFRKGLDVLYVLKNHSTPLLQQALIWLG